MSESFVTDVLVKFGGEPQVLHGSSAKSSACISLEVRRSHHLSWNLRAVLPFVQSRRVQVTEEGDIVYVFPELMVTAGQQALGAAAEPASSALSLARTQQVS